MISNIFLFFSALSAPSAVKTVFQAGVLVDFI
jgi:hypothetical protein